MKNSYPGYYRPTKDEFAKLWKDCLFALDANVLLNLYRYSTTTSRELLNIVKPVSDRIWLPYQAGLEYQRNRISVIEQQTRAYNMIAEFLDKTEKQIDNELRAFSRHPFIHVRPLHKQIARVFTRIRKDLEKMKKNHPNLLENDYIREEVTSLFDGKVGSPYSLEKLEEIYREGKKRYEAKIPPGYEDKNKDDLRPYGDLVLWFQIIDKAKEAKRPIIFVTDDRKDDWWLSPSGKTISPRPELLDEIYREAKVPFYMYQADPFMENAQRYIQTKIRQQAIDEVRAVRLRDEEILTAAQSAGLQISSDTIRRLSGLEMPQDLLSSIKASSYADVLSGMKASDLLSSVKFPNYADVLSGIKASDLLSSMKFPNYADALSGIKASDLLSRIKFPNYADLMGITRPKPEDLLADSAGKTSPTNDTPGQDTAPPDAETDDQTN